MLKRIEIPGYGPYVFGRKKLPDGATRFTSATTVGSSPAPLSIDSIREAAKSLHPIYRAEANMLGNDRHGCCTCAAVLHLQVIFDCAAGRTWREPSVADCLWLYSQTTNPPFDPSTGANDDGAEMQTVLEFWRTNGAYSDGTGKIRSWSAVDPADTHAVNDALETNGNLYAGADLPDEWLKVANGGTWGLAGEPNPDYGHCTAMYGKNLNGLFDNSWGFALTVTWPALAKYFGGESGELFTVVPA